LIRSTTRKAEKLKEVIGESHGRVLLVVLKLYGDRLGLKAEYGFKFAAGLF
jgi:hypothetical protein